MQDLGKSITDLDQLLGDGQTQIATTEHSILGCRCGLVWGRKPFCTSSASSKTLITPSHMLLDTTEPGLTLGDIGAQHVNAWHLLKRSEFCGSNKPRGKLLTDGRRRENVRQLLLRTAEKIRGDKMTVSNPMLGFS